MHALSKRLCIQSSPPPGNFHLAALAFHARFGISRSDSLIVASALETGCEALYSEDLNDGQDYGGVRVVIPFR